MTSALLTIEALTKRFDGVVASDNLSLEVFRGELHAIIGPNGAGKTTLVQQLAGETEPDSGRIFFDDQDITALPVHKRSLLGLARSFQIPSLFLEATALDNVALVIQAHAGHSCYFWKNARTDPKLREPALVTLKQVGMADRANSRVAILSHGERRQLELAMALAAKPRMLLLDEPLAGLGPEGSARMIETLDGLKRELTILLVEHDMQAVFALADRISVLVYGQVIASGVPKDIRANPEVRKAYLGEQSSFS